MSTKVLLAGYYGFDNFGDEAILEAILKILQQQYGTTVHCTVLSKNPNKTTSNYQVETDNRDNIFSIFKAILACDVFILGGGSLLQDATSLASLIYYYYLVKLAQLLGKKTVLLAQGIGPIHTKLGMLLTKDLIRKTNLVTLRDHQSIRLLNMVGLSAHLTSDPVWLLEGNLSPRSTQLASLIQGAVGLFLRPTPSIDLNHIETLIRSIDDILTPDIKIFVMPLQPSMDQALSLEITRIMNTINPEREIIYSDNNFLPSELIGLVSQLKFLVCMRYHGILAAIHTGVPAFGIAYDPKVITLMEDTSLPYIDLDRLKAGDYQEYLLSSWASQQIIKANNNYFKEHFVKAATLNFDLLHSIINDTSPSVETNKP